MRQTSGNVRYVVITSLQARKLKALQMTLLRRTGLNLRLKALQMTLNHRTDLDVLDFWYEPHELSVWLAV